MRGQHKGRVALRKFKRTIEIDIGYIPELRQRIASPMTFQIERITVRDSSAMGIAMLLTSIAMPIIL